MNMRSAQKSCDGYTSSLLPAGSHVTADAERVAPFGSAGGNNFAPGLGRHSLAKPVLVPSLSVMWLKCPFHCITLLKGIINSSKIAGI